MKKDLFVLEAGGEIRSVNIYQVCEKGENGFFVGTSCFFVGSDETEARRAAYESLTFDPPPEGLDTRKRGWALHQPRIHKKLIESNSVVTWKRPTMHQFQEMVYLTQIVVG